jgi:hypothetical protein
VNKPLVLDLVRGDYPARREHVLPVEPRVLGAFQVSDSLLIGSAE